MSGVKTKPSRVLRPAVPVRGSATETSSRWRLSTTFRASLASAVLLWAALPPLGWGLLAWVAPIGWLWVAGQRELDGRRPYVAIWVSGLVFWLGVLHWLRLPHWAASFGWVALSIYLAIYIPLFVALTRVAMHRLGISIVIAAPVVWTGLELARGHVLGGFTMGSLAHTQYRWPAILQTADLAGAYGVGFLMMFVAACIARALPIPPAAPRRVAWPAGSAVVALVLAFIYGQVREQQRSPEEGPRIALIQGSIDTEMKHDPTQRERVFREYFELSLKSLDQQPDLIVWPETMYRDPLVTHTQDVRPPDDGSWTLEDLDRTVTECHRRLRQVAEAIDCDLLLGIDTQRFTAMGVERYNSALFVSRDGEIGPRYDKTHPVMFGEYIPFSDVFPWLYRLTPLAGGIQAGSASVAFMANGTPIAANICYETVLPRVILRQVRELTRHGEPPQVLVNLTNSGWYWGSSELELHLACNVFRAVESRRPLLVAANTGISAWIDGSGRILRRGPKRATDVIVAPVELDGRGSPYERWGDWFAGLCLVACIGLTLVGFRRRTSAANAVQSRS